MAQKGYCVKCKKKVKIVSPKVTVRGTKKFNVGKCPNCGTAVWRILGNA